MFQSDYHFITHWRVLGTCTEVLDVLRDPTDLPRWWPSVYLDVRKLREGSARGIGSRFDLYTKGWLPYTLRWQLEVTHIDPPRHMQIAALGDFVGEGKWTFAQQGDWVAVTYDWRIEATKPLLRYGTPVFRPIFEANHRWAMAQGEKSLALELQRRHAKTPDQLAHIPSPPGPTTSSPLPLTLASLGGLALLWLGARRVRGS